MRRYTLTPAEAALLREARDTPRGMRADRVPQATLRDLERGSLAVWRLDGRLIPTAHGLRLLANAGMIHE